LVSGCLVALSAVAVAACGGGSATATTSPKTASGASASLGVANTSLGKVLVNSEGRTLYLFKADSGNRERMQGLVRGRVAATSRLWKPDRR
jgi:predicted lipoprotein with Yx(FWY)xxD motif